MKKGRRFLVESTIKKPKTDKTMFVVGITIASYI